MRFEELKRAGIEAFNKAIINSIIAVLTEKGCSDFDPVFRMNDMNMADQFIEFTYKHLRWQLWFQPNGFNVEKIQEGNLDQLIVDNMVSDRYNNIDSMLREVDWMIKEYQDELKVIQRRNQMEAGGADKSFGEFGFYEHVSNFANFQKNVRT